jgi:hypothetical protein
MFSKKRYLNYKKEINKNNIKLFFFFLILFVYFQEFKIFKNLYNILNITHDERAIKAYENTFFSGYCKGTSYGYIVHIKNKFNKIFNDNRLPKIQNHDGGEALYWIFHNVNGVIDENYVILINNKKIIDQNEYLVLDQFENKCFFLKKIND